MYISEHMDFLKITQHQLNDFKLIVDAYRPFTPIPSKDEWRTYTNDQLWFRHIGQVMVAGGSNSKEKFDRSPDLQTKLSLQKLRTLKESQTAKAIHNVLLASGVRYVGKDISKSAKTRALANNLNFILTFPGELTGIMEHLSAMQGPDAEIERVCFLMDNFLYLKNKSARDYLMGIGMNENTLAIDIRLRNIFSLLGMDFPTIGKLGSRSVYRRMEEELICNVCAPLNVKPIVLDRILYQNYQRIMKKEYRQQRLF